MSAISLALTPSRYASTTASGLTRGAITAGGPPTKSTRSARKRGVRIETGQKQPCWQSWTSRRP
eukprot:6832724-Prymnesium_polylepis.1